MKYKINQYVIVRPYSNPEGKIAIIYDITPIAILLEYIDGYDNFGRIHLHCDIDDNTLEIIGENDLDSVEALFGVPDDDESRLRKAKGRERTSGSVRSTELSRRGDT